MGDCVHCGGSGVLNIESIGDMDAPWRLVWAAVKYVAACHACEMGQVMAEVGVDA